MGYALFITKTIIFRVLLIPSWITNELLRLMTEPDLAPARVTAFVAFVSALVQIAVAHWNDSQVRKRELERERREAHLTFYDPLVSILKPLLQYLQSDVGMRADLSEYDDHRSFHRKKLGVAEVYCGYLAEVLRSFRSSLIPKGQQQVADDLITIRSWTMGVLYLKEHNSLPEGVRMPSDVDMVTSCEKLISCIAEDRAELFPVDEDEGVRQRESLLHRMGTLLRERVRHGCDEEQ